jgi:anti-sigma-K factor RskA
MDKEQFLSSGLLEQYVLGLTTPEESREVERHLKKYPELRAEAEAMRKGIEQYAMQHSIPSLSGGKKKNELSQRFDDESEESTRSRIRPAKRVNGSSAWWQFAASATILILGLLTLFLFQQQLKSSRAYDSLHAQFALFREQCADEKHRLLEKEHIYALLTDIDTRPIFLSGTQMAPYASAVIYWNEEEHKACLNPVLLPPPPAGRQYQLWAGVDGKMVSLGLVNRQFTELQLIEFIEDAESFNITIEPLGGSSTPTAGRLLANGKV